MASIAIGDSGVRGRCATEPKQDPKRQRELPKRVKKFRHKIVFLLHKFHLALAQVYKGLIEGVSFWVYQELTEKTEFLFNFISVLSVVSCRKNP